MVWTMANPKRLLVMPIVENIRKIGVSSAW